MNLAQWMNVEENRETVREVFLSNGYRQAKVTSQEGDSIFSIKLVKNSRQMGTLCVANDGQGHDVAGWRNLGAASINKAIVKLATIKERQEDESTGKV